MKIGLYANTHGIGYRDDVNNYTRSVPGELLKPVEVAQCAERSGFHSMWFPDHVCMPSETSSAHIANQTGARTYSSRHEMLDAAVVMGAVAASTSEIKLGTSVLVAPYRHPLSDARQFATVDVLAAGRLLFGVGAGWMAEEFEALGIEFAERGKRTVECIEIYKDVGATISFLLTVSITRSTTSRWIRNRCRNPGRRLFMGVCRRWAQSERHAFATVSIPCSWIRLLTLTVTQIYRT